MEKEFMPQFETEEQEAEYWDSHSPLDVIAEPRAQKVRVRGIKDKTITIRLDSQSRSKLDRLAAEQGLGPSSFARLIIMSVIRQGSKPTKHITLDELNNMVEEMPQSIKDRVAFLVKEATIVGDQDDPIFLTLNRAQWKEWGELGLLLILTLLAKCDIQVITQDHSKYEEIKTLVQSQK